MRQPARDALLLLGIGLVLFGAGIGLRDPWPADEPRFALVGKEMVETGEWLFPHRNGELYPDKPPVFFWLIASVYAATGSLRLAFLLPSALAGLGTLALTWDLARRLWGRHAAMLAGLALLATLQFTLQARTAQIDAVVALWITLAVYGLARHLLLGPAWCWWYVAFAAMGLGVITKGVGFLPVLLLVPWGIARWRRLANLPRFAFPWWHAVGGPLVMLAVIAAWLVPVMVAVAASGDPALAAYRDNILLRQTATRYAAAWHHRNWVGYYLLEVIPWAWLPLTAALPWLLPAWWRRLRRGDARAVVLLGWAALVLLFFSASPGKRGVYVLPVVPAFVLAAAPLLPGLLRRARIRSLARWGAAAWSAVALAVAGAVPVLARVNPRRLEDLGVDPALLVPPLAALGVAGLVVTVVLWRRRGVEALGAVIALSWLVTGFWVNPALNAGRYPAPFMAEVARRIAPGAELGMLAWREQFVLAADRPLVTFGYARRDLDAEAREGAAWLLAGADRRLLVPREGLPGCFDETKLSLVGPRHGRIWYLAGAGAVTDACRAALQRAVLPLRPESAPDLD